MNILKNANLKTELNPAKGRNNRPGRLTFAQNPGNLINKDALRRDIVLDNVVKNYNNLQILSGISMTIKPQRIVAILGPSACGKSTLLSILAGLVRPDSGTVTGSPGSGVSFLFQEPRLLDWLTVVDNLLFVLEDKLPRELAPEETLEQTVEQYLKSMDLYDYRHYYPRRLSGGQRQRVAIARALIYPSPVLLMDEPFKSLDLGLKVELIEEFLKLWSANPRTVICVTHDIKEALMMADEVYLLSQKPTMIKSHYEITQPRETRSFNDLNLLQIEQEIIGKLLNNN